jgi:hypothetical protein
MRWKNFVDLLEFVDNALNDKQEYHGHLGGNVFCKVAVNNACVDIRQYWKPQDDVVPTKKGMCLRPREYQRLKEAVPEIGRTLPELDAVVPCYL